MKKKNGVEEDEFSVCCVPPHSSGLSGLSPYLPHFLAAGIAIIRALKAIQCSGFCPGSKNFKDQERGLPVCG